MRRLAPTLLALALALLALPASALAANASIAIDSTGFSPASVKINPGESVTFTNNTLLATDSVQFDDETSARCATNLDTGCTRSFSTPGLYRFFDPQHSGCSSYATCVDPYRGVVAVDGPPVAVGTASPASAQRGAAVGFDATGSSDPDGDSLSYAWDFKDGTTATGAQTQHAFATAGHYDVTVTVSDSTGSSSATVPVDVTIPDTDGDGVNDDVDQCDFDPNPTPNGCPLVIPPTVGPLATTATAADELSVAGALRSGVNLVLSCSATCNSFITLTRGGSAVALPIRASLASGGSKLVTLRFTKAAKKKLAKLKTAKLQLQVLVTDALTRVHTRKATVVLKQLKTYGPLPAVGISDNQPATFDDPKFQVLRLRYARLVSPWNAVFTEPGRLDAWLQAARSHGIRPLVSFEHTRGQLCPSKHCRGPSKAQYTRAWKAFHRKYPWVKDISPWNEVNSATQPTGSRPDLAATYYNVVRASCRGCTIVAADLLDATNIRRYTVAFLAKAKGRPRLWGLHNYTDTNRFRARGTNALLQTVKGTVWLTETGGVVRFVTQKGKVALPKSESRAKKAMDYMFRLAEQNASRIKRIYVYQWKVNNVFDRFDAGVVRPNGTPRPSFDVLSVNASIARKR